MGSFYSINTKKKGRKTDENDEETSIESDFRTKSITLSGSIEDLAKRMREAQGENGYIAGAVMMTPDGKAIPLDSSGGIESILKSARSFFERRYGKGTDAAKEVERLVGAMRRDLESGKTVGNFDASALEKMTEESDRVAAEDCASLGPVRWGEYNAKRRRVTHGLGLTDDRASELLERLAELCLEQPGAGDLCQHLEKSDEFDQREKYFMVMHCEKVREKLHTDARFGTALLLERLRRDRKRKGGGSDSVEDAEDLAKAVKSMVDKGAKWEDPVDVRDLLKEVKDAGGGRTEEEEERLRSHVDGLLGGEDGPEKTHD